MIDLQSVDDDRSSRLETARTFRQGRIGVHGLRSEHDRNPTAARDVGARTVEHDGVTFVGHGNDNQRYPGHGLTVDDGWSLRKP